MVYIWHTFANWIISANSDDKFNNRLENVQWINIPLQIGDPTRQVARLFPHPDIVIADQKLSFRTIAVISAYIISLFISNSWERSL